MATSTQNKAKQRDIDNTNVSPPSPALARGGIAARVTANIIDALNNGVRPWAQPWDSATALGLPLRHNGLAYKGINVIALWAAAQTHGYKSRYWLTFKQALALGGAVRRGERGQPIVFYSDGTPAEDGEVDATTPRRAVLRSYVVFSADQIGGLPVHFYAPAITPPADNEAELVARFARVPALVEHGGARACYNPATDTIHLPARHAFISPGQYHSTRLHELGHWTGHATRLDRNLQPRASLAAYAREELTAELTSAFLGAELGLAVDHIECHASYIDGWLKLLDRDPGALLAAAGHAQRAADYLRTFLDGATDSPPA
jgi:antirestriction protein ArdC